MSRNILPIADRRETTRLAWRLLRKHRWPIVGSVVSFILVGLSALVPPWMMGRIVDIVRDDGNTDQILWAAGAIAGATVIGGIFSFVSISMLARAGEPALADLREQVMDRALHLEASRIESAGSGDLLARVGEDTRTIAEALTEVIPLLVNSVVLVGFTATGLFVLDWRLGLAGLVAGPFYVLGLRWYLPRSGPYYRRERIAEGERAQALVSGIQGARTLRRFSLEREQVEVIRRRSDEARVISVDVYHLLTRFFARSNRAELIGLTSVLGVGFLLVRSDAATVGAVTAAALYFHRLFNPIGALMFVFDSVQSTGASLARLAGVVGMPAQQRRPDPTTQTPGAMELRGVGHAYLEGRTVLEGIDLTVLPGERVAVVGSTGAGKTTLGAIAAGVLPPSSGQVNLAGAPLSEFDQAALRRRVVMISQDVHVFSGSIRESLTLVAPDAGHEEIRAALGRVGSLGWIDQLDDGLDTIVGEGAHQLTPAQAQLLALARVELVDPWFVVLDEATAEAGSAGARDLEEAALRVTKGRGALVVAHRLTQSQACDRVLVLHEGRVVEHGSHDDLLVAGGRYAELWAAWSGEAGR